MTSPICYTLNGFCEIYGRPQMGEAAAQAYLKACRVSEAVMMQRLVDWLRVSPRFPLPCDLMSGYEAGDPIDAGPAGAV
jgi:hypothetical protein